MRFLYERPGRSSLQRHRFGHTLQAESRAEEVWRQSRCQPPAGKRRYRWLRHSPSPNSGTVWINFAFHDGSRQAYTAWQLYTEIGFIARHNRRQPDGFYIRINGTCVVTSGPRAPRAGGTILAVAVFPSDRYMSGRTSRSGCDSSVGREASPVDSVFSATPATTQTSPAQYPQRLAQQHRNICTMAGWNFGDWIDDSRFSIISAILRMPGRETCGRSNLCPTATCRRTGCRYPAQFQPGERATTEQHDLIFQQYPRRRRSRDCDDLTVIRRR